MLRSVTLVIVAALAVLAAGCVTSDHTDYTAAPISQTSHIEGEVVLGSIHVGPYPLTFPVRAWGNGELTLQYPTKPHVIFSGDGGWIVEPITPEDAPTVRRLIHEGSLRIPGALAPSGSIRSRRTP